MDDAPQTAPFGTWTSPITAELLSRGSIRFEGLQVNVSTGQVYVLESRPAEGGRHCIVELLESSTQDILPKQFNAMSTVHEYGGGSFAISPDGSLIFTNHPTNEVFSLHPKSGNVTRILPLSETLRFADFDVHPTLPHWVLAVQEDHSANMVVNSIVAVNMSGGEVFILAQGADFYQHPKFSADGKQICWTQWNHPDMPWTGCELYTATWTPRERASGALIAGEARRESICQPRWGPDGTLFFVSDKTGYWQLYRLDHGATRPQIVRLKGLETAEFGSRESYLANCTYVVLTRSTIVAAVNKDATSILILIDLDTEQYTELNLGLVDVQRDAIRALSAREFIVIGTTRTEPQAVYYVNTSKQAMKRLLKPSIELNIPASLISESQHITFPRCYGENQVGSSHAIFAPPRNPGFQAQYGSRPPLILWMHGGPTTHVAPGLSLAIQYWTSRGYAYVCVNYAGSTGYGRAYRMLLQGEWGVIDIADAASCVSFLISQRLIDGSRVGIVGESAGGYAVLQALCVYPNLWAGAISLYGVSNLKTLVGAMHKFESQYVQQLVLKDGQAVDDVEAVYTSRSACYNVDKIRSPLLLLQGDQDTVVPESQTKEMQQIMMEQGKDVECVIYKGEGHGWEREDTIKASLEKEAQFWARTLL